MKNFIRRLFGKSSPEDNTQSANADVQLSRTERSLELDALEPRVLFSAAPVEAPGGAEEAETVQVETEGSDNSNQQGLPNDSTLLDQEALNATADAAKERWVQSGISDAQLEALNSVSYSIANLDANQLGQASGTSITIDDDAAGNGWFIDSTPLLDEEFSREGNHLVGNSDGADSGIDLLTLILHEQGHVMGLSDLDSDSHDLMAGLLNVGERHLPASGQSHHGGSEAHSGVESGLTTVSNNGFTLSLIGDGADDEVTLRINGTDFEYELNGGGFVNAGAVGTVSAITFDMGGGADAVNLDTSLSAFSGSVSVTGAETINLIANLSGTVSGDASTVNVAAGASIQDGIDLAASGATVNVAAGTFVENVTLDKDVELRGAQNGTDARGRAGGLDDSLSSIIAHGAGTGLELTAGSAGTTIDGFTFSGTGKGIESTSGPLDGVTIQNNQLVGFTGSGIFLNDPGDDVTIHQNVVDGTSSTGGGIIHLDQDSFDGFHLTSNWIVNASSGTGFFVDGTRNVGSSGSRDVLIDGNLFDGNAAGANLGRMAVENATISNNTFSNNSYDGLQGGPKDSMIIANVFTGNDRAGLRLTGFGGTGTATRGAQGNTVKNNVFSSNGAGAAAAGHGDIRIDDQFDGTQATNTIVENSLGSTVSIFNNETSGEIINASSNWWGGTNEAAIQAKHLGAGSGAIDFSPFLDSGTDADGGTAGFQGDCSTVHVTSLGGQSGATGRIQEGINRVDTGGTVNVGAGTFDELLLIDKSINLRGANAGVHAAVGVNTAETVGVRGPETILSHNGLYAIRPQADDITIDGFSFTGVGSRVIDDDGSDTDRLHITNNIFANTNTAASSGVIQLVQGSRTDLTIDFNAFTHTGSAYSFYAGGLAGTGDFDNLRIANNLFNSTGSAVFWGSDIVIVDGVVEQNLFDGNVGGTPGSGGGMNIGKAGNLSIRDNSFREMFYTGFQVGLVGGEILRNDFSGMRAFPGFFGQAFELWGGQWGTTVSQNVTIANNVINYNDVAGAAEPTHGLRLRAPDGGSGIDGSTITVFGNSFIDGGVRGDAKALRHQGDAATAVNASGNWWGATDSSAIAGQMEGLVDFTPFLTSGTDSDGATAGFQSDFSGVAVTTLGSQSGATGRLDEGASVVAATGTLTIEDGPLSPSDTAIGSVSTPNLEFGADSIYRADVVSSGSLDQLAVTGTVTIDSDANLVVAASGFPTVNDNDVFLLINNDGTDDAVIGAFKDNPEGTEFTNFLGSGKTARLTYLGGDGNDVALVVDGPIVVNVPDSGSTPEDVLIQLDDSGTILEISINGTVVERRPAAGVTAITIEGSSDRDTLTIDYTNGNPLFADVTFNGNDPTAGPGDLLAIIGDGTQNISYSPTFGDPSAGALVIDGRSVNFTGLEPVDITGALSFSLTLPGADDNVTISEGLNGGGQDALILSGNSGGVAFESPRVRNTGTIIIDTSSVDGSDTITISGAANSHGNTNLQIITGNSGTDSVTLTGDATFVGGSVDIQTETINLDNGGAGTAVLSATTAIFQGRAADTVGIGGDIGTFNLNDAELTTHLDISSSVTIGREDSTGAGQFRIGELDATGESYALTLLSGGYIRQYGDLTTDGAVTIRANRNSQNAAAFAINGARTITMNNAGAGFTYVANEAASGTGSTALADIVTGDGGAVSITQLNGSTLTLGAITAAGAGDVDIDADDALNVNGAIDAGDGAVSIAANTDATGADNLTFNAAASVLTTDGTANAISVKVNDVASGDGTGDLRIAGSFQTGVGGTVNFSTESLSSNDVAYLFFGNTTITNASVIANSSDLLRIQAGTTVNLVNAGTLTFNADTDSSGPLGFDMQNTGSLVTDNATAGAVDINVSGVSTGAALGNITVGDGGRIDVDVDGGGTISLAAGSTLQGAGGGDADIALNSEQTVTISGSILAGSLAIDEIHANSDGNGTGALTFGSMAVLTTSNTTAGAISVLQVNAPGAGTGSGDLTLAGTFTTGVGGTITASTESLNGGNAANLFLNDLTVNNGNLLLEGNDIVRINANRTVELTGGGTFTVNAGKDLTGVQGFEMQGGASLIVDNATAGAVDINVLGGSGPAILESITTGDGGTIDVNVDGAGTISHAGGTIQASGGGDVTVNFDSEAAIALAGTINAGDSKITVLANTDGAGNSNLTLNATADLSTANTASDAILLRSNTPGAGTGTGGLTIAGILNSAGGILATTLTGNGNNQANLFVNDVDVTVGTASALQLDSEDIVRINANQTLTISGGGFIANINSDADNFQNLDMQANSAIITDNATSAAIDINVIGGAGGAVLQTITTASGATIDVDANGTGTISHAGGTISASGGGDLTVNFDSEGAVVLSSIIDAGASTITVAAESDGSAGGNLTMNSGADLRTTNTGAAAISLTVNNAAGGDGDLFAAGTMSSGGGIVLSTVNGGGGNSSHLFFNDLDATVDAGSSLQASASDIVRINVNQTVTVNGGSLDINANQNGASSDSFEMLVGTSIVSTSTNADAVTVTINTAGGGSGGTSIRDITVGNGGGILIENLQTTVSTVTGTTLTATDGTVEIRSGDDLTLSGSIDAGTGTATLSRSTAGTIGVYGATAFGDLRIDQTELDRITAGTLNIGDPTGADNNTTLIRVNGVDTSATVSGLTRFSGLSGVGANVEILGANNFNSVEVNANNDIDIQSGASVSTQSGDADFTADADDDGTGKLLTAAGSSIDTSLANGNITITAEDADIDLASSIDAGGGNVTFLASQDRGIDLGGSSTSGLASLSLIDGELDLITTTGTLFIGNADSSDVEFTASISPLNAGTMVVTSGSKVIDTNTTGDDFTGTSLTVIAPSFAPAYSTGIDLFDVTGNFTFGANTNYDVDLKGNGGAGNAANGHDQTDVTGTVTIDPTATLTVKTAGLTAGELTPGDDFVIINNDDTDPVVGEFDSQPSGTIIEDDVAGSGYDLVLLYNPNGSNDVVLRVGLVTTRVTVDGGGNLVIEDIADSQNLFTDDDLTISVDTGANELVISDSQAWVLIDGSSIGGSTGNYTNELRVGLGSFTGNVILRTVDGDDAIAFENMDLTGAGQGITVEEGNGTDSVTFQTSDSDMAGGSVNVEAETVTVDSAINAAGGSITLNSNTNDLGINASVTTTGASAIDLDAANGAITQADATTISSGSGTITLDASGDLTIAAVSTSGNVTATSTTGALADGGNTATDVSADIFTATAVTGIDLDIAVSALDASVTGAGNIDLDETDGITLTDVDTANGSITIDAGGTIYADDVVSSTDAEANDIALSTTGVGSDIQIRKVDAGGTAGDVTITASGAITDGGDADVDVVGDSVSLTGTAIGATGDAISTTGNTLTTDTSAADGDQFIAETDGLTAIDLDAGTTGDITLSTGGAIADTDGATDLAGGVISITANGTFGASGNAIGTAATELAVNTSAANGNQFISETDGLSAINLDAGTGNIELTTGGAVTDTDGATDVTATDLTVTGNGFGASAANAIATSISNFEATGGTGTVFIANTGALDIGNIGGTTGVSANGDIGISSTGNLSVSEAITTNLGGDITLTTDTIDVNAGVSTTGNGNITIAPLTASTTIGIGGGTGTLNLTDAEMLNLSTLRTVTVGLATTGSGDVDIDPIDLSGKYNLHVIGGAISVTELDTGTYDVTLTANTGGITSGGNAGDDITAGDVTLTANGEIGSATDGEQIALSANTLVTDTSATNSNQYFSELTNVRDDQLNAGSGTVEINTSGRFDLTDDSIDDATSIVVEDGATLNVNGATDTFAGLTVNVDGTVMGSGTLDAPVVVNNGGLVTPGTNGTFPGQIATGNLSIATGGTFTVDIDGTAGAGVAIGGHDQLVVNGTVTLTDATLDLEPLGTTGTFSPANGTEFIIIDNDGADAVTGNFIGLTEGTYISAEVWPTALNLPDELFQITYQGGDGNDVVLTATAETATSNVFIDGAGNLVVEDILGSSDTADNLSISRVGTDFIIEDLSGNVLGTLIVGATQTGLSRIVVPEALVTGGVIIDTLGGDDTITIGELGTLNGELTVNGGTGIDTINQNGDAIVGADFNATYTADTINFGNDADVSTSGAGTIGLTADRNVWLQVDSSLTTDTGDITLSGNTAGSGTGNFVGVWLDGASVSSTSGEVSMTGQGGSTLSYNDGIRIGVDKATQTASSVSTGGSISLTGTGGTAGAGAHGVMIQGSSVQTTGAGTSLVIDGTGGAAGNYAQGVYLYEASLSTASGDLTLDGTGAGPATSSQNNGISVWGGSLTAGATGNLDITGTSGNGTSSNYGVFFYPNASATVTDGDLTLTGTSQGSTSSNRGITAQGLTLTSNGSGDIRIAGTGSGTGNNNYGVDFSTSTLIEATGSGIIDIDGTASTSGGSYGRGVMLYTNTTVRSAGGNISIDGSGHGSGYYNEGLAIQSGSTVEITAGSGNLTLTGTGGNGILGNNGVALTTNVTLATADGDLSLVGTGRGSSLFNKGLLAQGASLSTSGGNLSVQGTGSLTSTSYYNYGIEANATSFTTTGAGTLTLLGNAGSGALGNAGVLLSAKSSASTADGDLTIRGTGNGTVGMGKGVLLSATDLTTSGSGNLLVAGTGSASSTGYYNYGIEFALAASAKANGTGTLTLEGNGGSGSTANNGIQAAARTQIASTSGDLSITGSAHGTALNSGINFLSGSTVSTTTGNLTIRGSSDGTGYMSKGIVATASTFSTTGGNLSIDGTGSQASNGHFNRGIEFGATSSATTTGAGTLTLRGTGGSGTMMNNGIVLLSSNTLSSADGDLTVQGSTGNATGGMNKGVTATRTTFLTTGAGDLLIEGSGSAASTSYFNTGIEFTQGATADATGTGSLTLNGTGGTGTTGNIGVSLGTSSRLTTVNGDLTVNATAKGTGSQNGGALSATNSIIRSTGSGELTLRGTGSTTSTGYYNRGIYLYNATVSASTGDLTLLGTGGSGLAYNHGIQIQSGSVASSSGALIITGQARTTTTGTSNTGVYLFGASLGGNGSSLITGTGGAGTGTNHGVYLYNTSSASLTLANVTGTAGTGGSGASASLDIFGDFL